MANKKWYTITAECIKWQPCSDCKIGEVLTLAKVVSKGNAYTCANALSQVYKPEYFKIRVI